MVWAVNYSDTATVNSMKFSFLSTTQDLVDAYDALASKSASIRGVYRLILLAFGWLWLLGGGYELIVGPERLKGLFFLLCGPAILWKFSGRRLLDIYRIRASGIPDQQTSVSFSSDGIDIDVAEKDHSRRTWDQLDGYDSVSRGFAFRFKDGRAHWLPRRAFSSELEVRSLVDFLNRNLGESRKPV